MSNKLICPFCNGELVGTIGHPICRNQNCVMCDDPMPQDLLEELIRTRKALDVAVDALKTVKRYLCEMPAPDGATVLRMACESATTVKKALEQITATLENQNGNC